ncbi:MAG: GNAT family N-acetyltransferase [bacterium]
MLDDDWRGRRVVVRHWAGTSAAGREEFRDVLGDLLQTGDEIVVDTRSGRCRIPRAAVASARLVHPAAVDQLGLEAIAARGWRPRTVETSPDGWLLRADAGWTGRANSALALHSLRRPLPAVTADLSTWYAAHGLPARVQVPLPALSALDHGLEELGWTVGDDVDVLVARLDLLADQDADPPNQYGLDFSPTPTPDWLAGYHYRGGALPPPAAALLSRHDRVVFLTARDPGGRVAGVARGAVDDGWLGITAVDVVPSRRRQGCGRQLMLALGRWGAGKGAQRCYLQVSTGNRAAATFYGRLGFHRHHTYRYRDAPHRP